MSRFHIAARRLRGAQALTSLSLLALLLPSTVGMTASAAWNDAVRVVPGLETTLQTQPASCGPALIATLATWSGSGVSEATVIAQADLSHDGVSLAEFARLASLHALDGTWYRVEQGRLGGLSTPFVAHLHVATGGHFVADVAQAADKVVVVDPGPGVLVGPLGSLLRGVSGRVFVLKNRPS